MGSFTTIMGLFFAAIGIDTRTKGALNEFSKKVKISVPTLEYYDSKNILPSSSDLHKLTSYLGITPLALQLAMGIVDQRIQDYLIAHSKEIAAEMQIFNRLLQPPFSSPQPVFTTAFGELYRGDCIQFLQTMDDEVFDVVFADPPFNLNKSYLSAMDDNLSTTAYISWCEAWLGECIRTLKPGGSLFIWNIPRWNSYVSRYLNERLNFKHWIATDIKLSLPIQGKLYPSHYSLLYYTKGERAHSFNPDRLPMEVCRKCYHEIKDYGGYKNKMNPKGINMTDIWTDIPPVRHKKYKKREEANELSIKLLDRIIEMSSNPGDTIFDPFGGSGTTYVVAEMKQRKWKGIELGPIDSIVDRFENIQDEIDLLSTYRDNYNTLFTHETKVKRKQKGLWTDDTFKELGDTPALKKENELF